MHPKYLAGHPEGAKKTMKETKFTAPYTLIFGNEGEGLGVHHENLE